MVDLVTGAVAMSVGSTIATAALAGTAVVPPLGTIAGVVVGIGISVAINVEFGDPPNSVVGHVKDGVKYLTHESLDNIVEFGENAADVVSDSFDAVSDTLEDIGSGLKDGFDSIFGGFGW